MNDCSTLALTGLDANLGVLLLVVVALLTAGTLTFVLARSRRVRGAVSAMVVLLVGAGLALAPAAPAQAATSDCVTGSSTLTITQTSTMADLAPGVAPVAITGLIENHGPDSADVSVVDVAITSVSTAAGADGVCDASDYVLLRTRMPVGQTLAPGQRTPFAGAAIGFSDKTTNQDACQRATIHLRYTAVPGS